MILQLSFQDDTLKAEFLNPRNQQIINRLLVENVEGLMPNPFFDGAHSSSLPMSGLENVIHWGLPILANKAGVITITTITYAKNDEAHQQVYEIVKLLYPKAQHLFG